MTVGTNDVLGRYIKGKYIHFTNVQLATIILHVRVLLFLEYKWVLLSPKYATELTHSFPVTTVMMTSAV